MSLSQYLPRHSLHNEVHARPPEALTAPLAITHVVMLANPQQREASRLHLAELLRNQHLPLPDAASTHIRMDMGPYRLRWEMHTEFVTWTFFRPLDGGTLDPADPVTANQVVPQDWFVALPGECLASVQLWVLPANTSRADELGRLAS